MPTSPPLPAANADPPAIPSQDVVESLPAPIVRLLLIFSGPIRGARVCLEVACWRKGRRMESWMIVGAWWGLCLGAKYAFRYLAPAILFLPLLPMSRLSLKRKPTQGTTTIHTHQTLLLTISDLHAINALLPPSPIPNVADLYDRFRQLGPRRLIRGCVVIWLAWIILGRVIGYRSLLALLGSIIFLAPSPPFAHLVHLLSRSLMIRRLIALLFLVAFGSPPDQSVSVRMYFSPVSWAKQKWAVSRRSSLAFSFQTKKTNTATISDLAIMDDDDDEETVEPVYFRFEVHENQRWWMGLDWTSALLPQERPSWCDSHLQPVSPPASFSLPPSSSVILPNAGKEGGRVKRTAIWKWYDDDWSIVRAGANAQGSQSTANPVPSPSIDEDGSHTTSLDSKRRSFSGLGTSPSNSNLDDSMAGRAHSMAEQAFTKGLERLKARTTSPAGPPSPKNSSGATLAAGMTSPGRTSGEFQRARKGSQASEDAKDNDPTQGGASSSSGAAPIETIAEKDDATDADGWVYGDNKWENMGPKGGLGRFTRRRRWQRRAVLTETVQHLAPGPTDEPTLANLKSGPAATVISEKQTVVTTKNNHLSEVQDAPSPIPEELEDESDSNGTPRAFSDIRIDRVGLGVIPVVAEGSIASSTSTNSRDDALRMRLKKAMGNMGA